MVTILGCALLIALFIFHLKLDKRIWGSGITPGVIIIGGYAFIVLIHALASLAYETKSPALSTYFLIAFFTILTMLTSVLMNILVAWKRHEIELGYRPSGKLLRIILLFVSITYGVAAFNSADILGGLWSSESSYGLSTGSLAHLHVLLATLAIWYSVSTKDQPPLRYTVLLITLLALAIYPVRGWTLIPLVAISLSGLARGRFSVRTIIYVGLGVFLASALFFYGIYLVRAEISDYSLSAIMPLIEFITLHYLFYLTAGLSGLDAVVDGLLVPGDIAVLFAPFFNFYAALIGEPYVQIISNRYVDSLIVEHSGSGVNVYSMYGSVIGIAGYLLGAAIILGIVAFVYILHTLAWRSGSSALRAATYYIVSVLSFGWFEYYLWHLTPYEVLFLCIFLYLIELIFSHYGIQRNSRDINPI